jgi:hypothetical protein
VANGEVLALAKTHQAILVIEAVHRHLRDALTAIPPSELAGCLLIVDPNKYRLRRPA